MSRGSGRSFVCQGLAIGWMLLLILMTAPSPALAQPSGGKGAAAKGTPAKGAASPAAAVAEPATPEQAAKVLDLRTFPVIEGARVGGVRSLGIIMYAAPLPPKEAFEFQRKELTKLGFKELPGGYQADDNYSGHFTNQGFVVAVSASPPYGVPDKAIRSSVTLVNNGNIDLGKLPTPPGVKPFHPNPHEASYSTAAKPLDTAAACRKLLLAAGWEPYGRSDVSRNQPDATMEHFKKNGIKLQLWVMTTPAEGGKTLIRYSTDLFAADLPAPPEVEDPDYTDSQKQLRFAVPVADTDKVYAFYQERLKKMGWTVTTDHPIVDKNTSFLVFRNAAKDLLSLDLVAGTETVSVSLKHLTAVELEEQDKIAKAAALKQKMEDEVRNRKIKVAFDVPAGATKVRHKETNLLEFSLPTGSGPTTIKAFREPLKAAGWIEKDDADFDKTSGDIHFEQEHATLRVSYFDIGFGDVDITVSGSKNVVLEPKNAKGSKPTTTADMVKDAVKGKKPVKPAVPGLPELPPGVELPPEVNDLLKKALEQQPKPPGKAKR